MSDTAPLETLAVHAPDAACQDAAEALSARIGAPVATSLDDAREHRLALLVGADGVTLTDWTMTLQADFSRDINRIAPQNLRRELLVKAARVKEGDRSAPVAIDATAGLGEDSLLLAAAGFEVRLYERNPVIACLLQDALSRGAADPRLADAVGRMHLVCGDGIQALRSPEMQRAIRPDVVLLDPMFPEKRKAARVKKKLQLLQQLEQPCEDEGALLEAALGALPRKVIVKRPVKGPWLAGRKPAYALSGKAVRFDCYVC